MVSHSDVHTEVMESCVKIEKRTASFSSMRHLVIVHEGSVTVGFGESDTVPPPYTQISERCERQGLTNPPILEPIGYQSDDDKAAGGSGQYFRCSSAAKEFLLTDIQAKNHLYPD